MPSHVPESAEGLASAPPARHVPIMKLAPVPDPDAAGLSGKLLIAMPGMGDPRFERAVVFVCDHSDEGAMGLIVNKPTDDLRIGALFDQLEIETGPEMRDLAVHFGGPVETARGFVLHSAEYESAVSTLQVGAFGMTATLDVLEDLARGDGPERAMLALGYAGWGPGQIEEEIAQNAWLTCDATVELVFAPDPHAKWSAALSVLGVDALVLSPDGGRA